MTGIRAFAGLACSALGTLSPLEAAAWDEVTAAHARSHPVASPALRAAAVAMLLLGALIIFWGWLRRETALGRSIQPTADSDVDGEWLERNVFSLSPELVGAAYDGRVAGSEVAAVLARMCGQSKLASRVAAGARGWNNLELWLLVERDELEGYERDLVDQLFGASKTTSGELIQQRHDGVGFDPAAILRGPVHAACAAALGVRCPRRWPLELALGGAALGFFLTMAAGTSSVLPVLLAAALGALGPLCDTLLFAPRYRRDPTRAPESNGSRLASTGASVVMLAVLIVTLPSLSPLAPLALAGWGLLGAALLAWAAATRESAGGLTIRRNLLAARRFLAAELERPEPRLRDEWLPYLISLELTSKVERWYQAFGRIETATRRERLTRRSELAEDAAAPCWTGGAGALGGIGPSGPWIAASAGLTVVPSRARRASRPELARRLQLKQA
jgi:hypothetical protein